VIPTENVSYVNKIPTMIFAESNLAFAIRVVPKSEYKFKKNLIAEANITGTVIDILTADRRPALERTNTSKEGDRIEEMMNKKLGELALELAGIDPKTLSKDDKKVIINIINGFVQKAYFTGQDYADRVKGEIKPIDEYDLETINGLTEKAVIGFLKMLEPDFLEIFRLGQNKSMPIFMPNIGLDSSDFKNIDTSKTKLNVRGRKTLGFTNKEVKKMKLEDRDRAIKLYDLTEDEYDELETQQDLITAITTSIALLSSMTAIQALNEGTLSNATNQVEFVTRRDEKVCPICDELDGNRYDVDPLTHIIDGPLPGPPELGGDTHWNCRCRYLLVSDDSGELLIG
jgi:hypothetical protein